MVVRACATPAELPGWHVCWLILSEWLLRVDDAKLAARGRRSHHRTERQPPNMHLRQVSAAVGGLSGHNRPQSSVRVL